MKSDKIHQGLLDIKQHIKNAGTEHKALSSQAAKIIRTADTMLADAKDSPEGSARLKKMARLFLEIEDGLNKELGAYSEDIHTIIGDGGSLQKLGKIFSDLYLEPLMENGTQIKSFIRRIENPDLRKALNRHFRVLREEAIVRAVEQRSVSWANTLPRNKKNPFGRGLDERVIEFPLAFDAARFNKPGKILDAGAALNLPYIHATLGKLKARIVHFTQSGDKEIADFAHDRYSYLFGDLRNTDFKDGTFDCVLCVSTLEHIGMDNSRYGENETASTATESRNPRSYLHAVKEMLRILAPGGRLVITVPYGRAKDYGWFQVFDSDMVGSILELCDGHQVMQKYYDYDNGWYEGSASSAMKMPDSSEDAVGSVCALLITKSKA